MGKHILKDVELRAGAYNLSADSNQLAVDETYDEVENTTFGALSHTALPGIPKVSMSFSGYAEANSADPQVDDVIESQLGSTETPMSFCPVAAANGGVCYFTQGMILSAQRGGAVGEMYGFTVSGVGQGSFLVRGSVLSTGARTATGTGTALQVGATSATQKLYTVMHVLAASGTTPTLDMVIESDDAVGMASATPRITFTQATDVGGEFKSAAGAITDDWLRVSYTIGGTDPSFSVLVAAGIR